MNIVTKQKQYQGGSVLLVALMTAWIIGIALVSYLTLVAHQNRSTYSSLAWNSCIPVLEAGVEEAMAQIHSHANDNLGANQWTFNAADGRYHKSRQYNDGSSLDGSSFDVAIQPNDPSNEPYGPVIYSTGYVPGPATTGFALGGETAFGMILGSVTGSFSSAPRLVRRDVRVTTIRQGFAPGGLNAKGLINGSGGTIFDSFDSSDPKYSSGGQYNPALHKANAKAITNLQTGDAVNLGNTDVYGMVTTGSTNADVTVGSGGAVGDIGWNTSNSGIQPGHKTSDANLQFDDVLAPFPYGTGITPMPLTVGGVLYTWVMDSGNYNTGSLNMSGGKTMLVTGNSTLYINGNLNISGGSGIVIAPGASLKIYLAGSANISGNGIVNQSGRAKNLLIYGLNTCTSFSCSGTSDFIGAVYAPHAAIKFSGSMQAIGAFSGDNVTFSGGAHIVYDEDLKKLGDFILESWNEI